MATTTLQAISRRRRAGGMLAGVTLALTLLAGSVVPSVGQQSTPDPVAPAGQNAQATEPANAAQEDPASGTSNAPSSASANLSAAPQTAPALAQGLIYLDGGNVVWQAREVELAPPAESGPVTGSARFVLQRAGASIIRNDVTGKRTRLEQDEVYFAAAGDPYTTMAADNSPSVVWIVEVANTNQVGEGAFYLSPDTAGVAEGTYDLELTQQLLEPGDSTGFVTEGGPFLIMVMTGQIAVSDGSGEASLVSNEGRIVDGNATIEAEGDEQAVYAVVAVGGSVSDVSAAVPAADDSGVPGIGEDDLGSLEVDVSAVQDVVAEESAGPAAEPEPSGDFVTSITVAATAPVTVSVIVDGVSVFDGYLETGDSTEYFTGSVFEVYTTSGVNTTFANTCSDEPFVMGYDEGDAYYVLEATASSCAPVE